MPYEAGEWERWVAIGDNHGEFVHKADADVFFNWLDYYKPHVRIHLGDNFDFTCLRLMKSAEESDRAHDLVIDTLAGKEFLERYRPHVYMLGNHEARLIKACRTWDGIKRSLALQLNQQLDEFYASLNIRVLPYHYRDGVFELGDHRFLHGNRCGVNAVRMLGLVYRNMTMGHLHTIECHTIEGLDHAVASTCGCMCDYDRLNYAQERTATSKWQRGWEFGLHNTKTGRTVRCQAARVDGHWIIPNDITVREAQE